jgi:hypothetical protein
LDREGRSEALQNKLKDIDSATGIGGVRGIKGLRKLTRQTVGRASILAGSKAKGSILDAQSVYNKSLSRESERLGGRHVPAPINITRDAIRKAAGLSIEDFDKMEESVHKEALHKELHGQLESIPGGFEAVREAEEDSARLKQDQTIAAQLYKNYGSDSGRDYAELNNVPDAEIGGYVGTAGFKNAVMDIFRASDKYHPTSEHKQLVEEMVNHIGTARTTQEFASQRDSFSLVKDGKRVYGAAAWQEFARRVGMRNGFTSAGRASNAADQLVYNLAPIQIATDLDKKATEDQSLSPAQRDALRAQAQQLRLDAARLTKIARSSKAGRSVDARDKLSISHQNTQAPQTPTTQIPAAPGLTSPANLPPNANLTRLAALIAQLNNIPAGSTAPADVQLRNRINYELRQVYGYT